MHKRQYGFAHIIALLLVFVIVSAVGYLGIRALSQQTKNTKNGNPMAHSDPALNAGKTLSYNNCEGRGPVKLGTSPMKPSDFSIVIPYGLVVGGHVTPIDHQYLSPTVFNSPPDTYDVRAMADGNIVDISLRDRGNGQYDHRLVFSHTCTFLTYYDLVTSLTPALKKAFDSARNGSNYAKMNYPVKAGDVIGKIGGQTLDFAVWDTEKPLKGFINVDTYKAEPWKLYTADPYDYYTPDLKKLMTERNPRTVEPIAGKIDYDQEGKLIGNWFKQGTHGYEGTRDPKGYWGGHFSIAPNLYDPSKFMISLGDWKGEATQFIAVGNKPDPATVTKANGVVKYELSNYNYVRTDGSIWMQMDVTKNPTVIQDRSGVQGALLVQVLDNNTLKLEKFPGKRATQVTGFDKNAETYER